MFMEETKIFIVLMKIDTILRDNDDDNNNNHNNNNKAILKNASPAHFIKRNIITIQVTVTL